MQIGDRRVKVLGRVALLHVSGTRDERMSAIAGFQRGRLTRKQLLDAGIGRGSIRWMRETSRLHPLHDGVYAVGHAAAIELGAETAALLACPDGAVVSHRSAGALWGLCGPPRDGTVHITVLGGGRRQQAGITIHRTKRLDRQDVRVHRDLPVTSPARTLLDLAAELPTRELERALDEALFAKVVRRAQIDEAIKRLPRRHGATVLQALLNPGRPSSATDSHPEARLRDILLRSDLPAFDVHYPIGPYTVDFYWPGHRVAVEVDGYRYHSTRRNFERDRRKDAYLKARKIDVNRFSADQVEQRPFATIARITERLAAASPG